MWLLESNTRHAMEQAHLSGILPSAEQQVSFEAARSGDNAKSSRILAVAGSSAEISIKGVLTKSPNWFAQYFGGGNVTYSEIISALQEADNDPQIQDITLAIDSGGGQFDGLFDTLSAIQSVNKPIKAMVYNLAASAAYAIASQADSITANNIAARVGSIGVVAGFSISQNSVDITSTNAPKKRPDVTTDDGKAMVREELDALHQIFVEAIAEGRGKDASLINNKFGQGATLLAKDALSRGMIDAINGKTADNDFTRTATSGNQNQQEARSMDLNTLKAQHPATFSAAVQQGVDQERDRVNAHLTMGAQSGDMKTALSAVEDGSAMTMTHQAKYMSAGMNRSDSAARQEDNIDAEAVDGVADQDNQSADKGEDVAALVENALGLGE